MIKIQEINQDDLIHLRNIYIELTENISDLTKMNNNFSWMQKNKDYIILGAKQDGILLGSVMGVICRDLIGSCRPFMVIENMIVKSDSRGKGVGTKLIKYIENIARDRNCYFITFVSSFNRKKAHNFYQSLGYSIDSVQGFKKYL